MNAGDNANSGSDPFVLEAIYLAISLDMAFNCVALNFNWLIQHYVKQIEERHRQHGREKRLIFGERV